MSKKNKKIDKLFDGLLDEESKSNTLIIHSETKKALLDDTIELLKENGSSNNYEKKWYEEMERSPSCFIK